MIHKKKVGFEIFKSDKWLKFFSALVVFLLFFSIMLSLNNFKQNTIINSQSYDIFRRAENKQNYDSFVDKKFNFNSHLIISFLMDFFNYNSVNLIVLSVILVLSLLLIFKISSFVLILLIPVSPLFAQYFLIFNDYTMAVFFLLICLYLYKKKQFITSLVPFFLCLFFNTVIGSILFIFTLTLVFKKKLKKNLVFLYSIPFLAFIIFMPSYTIINPQFNFIEFGSIYGLSFVIIAISILGYGILKENCFINIPFFSVFFFIFIDLVACFFILNIIFLYILSEILKKIFSEKWNNENLKNMTIVLLICIVLFSSITHLSFIFSNLISTENIELLESFKDKSIGVILAPKSIAYEVKFFAQQNVLIDQEIDFIHDGKSKKDAFLEILKSRNIETTTNLINEYNISHIIITKDLINNFWDFKDDGFLFISDVFPNKFVLVNSSKDMFVYEFINS